MTDPYGLIETITTHTARVDVKLTDLKTYDINHDDLINMVPYTHNDRYVGISFYYQLKQMEF